MPTPDQLSQLRDLHLPPPVSWWPMAPGWWCLIALLLGGSAYLAFIITRRYVQGRARRFALQLLTRYEQQARSKQQGFSAAELSALLKRVALAYFPRAQVAPLQGDAWLLFLNQTAKGLDFNTVRDLLIHAPYQPYTNLDLSPLLVLTRAWITQRRARCSN